MNYSSYHTARLIEISSQIEHVHYEFDYLSKLLLSCLRTKKSITKLLNFVKSGATNQKVCLSIISNIYIFIYSLGKKSDLIFFYSELNSKPCFFDFVNIIPQNPPVDQHRNRGWNRFSVVCWCGFAYISGKRVDCISASIARRAYTSIYRKATILDCRLE